MSIDEIFQLLLDDVRECFGEKTDLGVVGRCRELISRNTVLVQVMSG